MTYRDLQSWKQRFSRNTNISCHSRYQSLLSEDDVVIIEQRKGRLKSFWLDLLEVQNRNLKQEALKETKF